MPELAVVQAGALRFLRRFHSLVNTIASTSCEWVFPGLQSPKDGGRLCCIVAAVPPTGQSTRLVQFGVFEADLHSGELSKQGRKIRLQAQPFAVLKALLERPGELVTREELRTKIWGEDTFVDFDRALNKAVTAIRDALGDSAESPRFVETLPKRGYRLVAPVTVVYTNGAAQLETQQLPSPSVPVGQITGAWRWVALSVCVAAVLIGAIAYLRRGTSVPAPIRSLAVLPIRPVSGDAAEEQFADAMTDELITVIAGIEQVRVVARTSAMRYKQSTSPAEEIARELKVDAFLQGTAFRDGNRVRVNVRLTRVRPEEQVWAQSYERDLRGVLQLQAELATSVANAIHVKLTPRQTARLARAKPVRPEAYTAYVKGRYFWGKRTEQDLAKAINHFQEAIRLDPQYAAAYAGLAACHLVNYSGAVSPESMARGRAAAIIAVQLDGESAEAQTCLARAKLFGDWDWNGAERAYQQAIALNPNDSTAHQWYGIHLSIMGRHREAMKEYERARELDPVSPAANAHVGLGWYLARDYDKAIGAFRNTLELEPSFNFARRWLAVTYAQKGIPELALREGAIAVSQGSGAWLAIWSLTYAQAAAGQRDDAIAGIEHLKQLSETTYVAPYLIASLYAALGERDPAFEWLEKAYQERSSVLPLIRVHGWFDHLQSDARYANLIERIGLPR